ncbi:NUMOD4 domain-containing protein [Thermoactinomyces sp. DSM 45892]|uniref:NUMOD4 domain-containing protein n=1 Tax=Thermoactinomyces sp. DSM 45892 TaxID=1882753 RepID=UPI0008975572|nr:NUMOD4 domain-containing protein [Thermoactinomyces sp. DSM 45892]SDY83283.1 HNH endonuclease [Thermoactinomyces sp. DSM 45892]
MIEFSLPSLEKMRECWRDIPSYEGYQISSFGRVIRKRQVKKDRYGNRRVLQELAIKSFRTKRGYMYVNLHQEGMNSKPYIHRLVVSSFFPEALDEPVRHKDGKRANNRLDNLEFFLSREDFIQSPIRERELIRELTAHSSSLLSHEDEEFVKYIHRSGCKEFGMAVLAREYGVDIKEIKRILEVAQ